MAARARRGKTGSAKSPHERLGDEGAERYMWVFPEGDQIVLTIPGLRDLKLSVTDARTIGEMLIQTADEITRHRTNQTESGDNNGSTEEHPTHG
jgi:hypothetical protein